MSNQRIYEESKDIGRGVASVTLHKLDLPYYPAHYLVRLSWWATAAGPTNEQSYLHQFTVESSAIRFTIELFDDYITRLEPTP